MFCTAEYLASCTKERYEVVHAQIYAAEKKEGSTEKQADALARVHPDVQEAKKNWIKAKTKSDQIARHVKAWDKAHDCAQSRGHMMRKEMDKLHTDIYFKNKDLAEKVSGIVKGE